MSSTRQSRKPILMILLFSLVITVVYLLVSRTLSPSPVDINLVTASGTVSLEASPVPATPYLNENVVLDVNAKFADNAEHLTAVQLELTYDAAKLELLSFAPTSYLPNALQGPTLTSGKLVAALGSPTDGARATWGTVGKITVKAKALGEQVINFGPGTLAAGTSSSGNILKSVTPILIKVYNRGDINRDKVVDIYDYNAFVRDFGKTGANQADFNRDNVIDIYDYNTFVQNFGKTSP